MRKEGITLYAAEGKKIAPVGSKYAEDFGSAFTLLKGQTEADFIEMDIADLPAPRPEEPLENYDEKVNNLIRERYTESQEFAILRQRDSKPEEFARYNAYCEECKTKAKEPTTEQANG